jgi:hypothetical protein
MGLATWLRLLETVGGLAELSRRFRGDADEAAPERPRPSEERPSESYGYGDDERLPMLRLALGHLETGLTNILVAALKEAFDRDRARLDLERDHVEAERRRAEEALRVELLRQSGERVLSQMRLLALIGIAVWVSSAVLMVLLPGMGELAPRILLACGWVALIATLACAFIAHQQLSGWLAAAQAGSRLSGPPGHITTVLTPWLLVAGLGFTAASLIVGL